MLIVYSSNHIRMNLQPWRSRFTSPHGQPRLLNALSFIGVALLVISGLTLLFEVKVTIRRTALFNRLIGLRPAPAAGTSASAPPTNPASSLTAPGGMEQEVLPPHGVALPVRWGDLGVRLVRSGVIDLNKFTALYASRGGLDAASQALLTSPTNGPLVINQQNSGLLLNLLWAFGLANKNPILDRGPMQNPAYGGAGGFASTGGWTLAKGDAMSHYSKYAFVTLTPDQQQLVERVSKGIYRPCCGNSTYFPDCNHGMAMLGLLELLAAEGATEEQMYRTALAVNSYWFPDTYLTIANYLAGKGIIWNSVDPRQVLGASFSSAQGFRQIQSQVAPTPSRGGSGCGA